MSRNLDRTRGLGFTEIGEILGLSRGEVTEAYKRAMQKMRTVDPRMGQEILAELDGRRQEIIRRESYGIVP